MAPKDFYQSPLDWSHCPTTIFPKPNVHHTLVLLRNRGLNHMELSPNQVWGPRFLQSDQPSQLLDRSPATAFLSTSLLLHLDPHTTCSSRNNLLTHSLRLETLTCLDTWLPQMPNSLEPNLPQCPHFFPWSICSSWVQVQQPSPPIVT